MEAMFIREKEEIYISNNRELVEIISMQLNGGFIYVWKNVSNALLRDETKL